MVRKKAQRKSEYQTFLRKKRLLLARVRLYDAIDNNFASWLEQLKVRIPDERKRSVFLENAVKRRDALLKELAETLEYEEKAFSKIALRPLARRVAVGAMTATVGTSGRGLAACPQLDGRVESNRFYMMTQDDWGDATVITHKYEYLNDPDGQWESIRFKHHLIVGDACMKSDLGGLSGVAVLQYEFPEMPCKGQLFYEADLSLHLTTFKYGWGAMAVHVLVDEQSDGAGADPNYEDFSWTSEAFGSNGGYDYASIPIAGRMNVDAGKKPKLRVAIDVESIAGENDNFGTNGWCYFMVWRLSGQSRFGVKYHFEPS